MGPANYRRLREQVNEFGGQRGRDVITTSRQGAKVDLFEWVLKNLKKRGFTFVGSTICYAFMQATGMVNDHAVECFRYRQV